MHDEHKTGLYPAVDRTVPEDQPAAASSSSSQPSSQDGINWEDEEDTATSLRSPPKRDATFGSMKKDNFAAIRKTITDELVVKKFKSLTCNDPIMPYLTQRSLVRRFEYRDRLKEVIQNIPSKYTPLYRLTADKGMAAVFTALPINKGLSICDVAFRELLATQMLCDPTTGLPEEEDFNASNPRCPACSLPARILHPSVCINTGMAARKHNIVKNVTTAALGTQIEHNHIATEIVLDYIDPSSSPPQEEPPDRGGKAVENPLDDEVMDALDGYDGDAMSDSELISSSDKYNNQIIENQEEEDLKIANDADTIEIIDEETDAQWRFVNIARERRNDMVRAAMTSGRNENTRFVPYERKTTVADIVFKHPAFDGLVAVDLVITSNMETARKRKIQTYEKFLKNGVIQHFVPFAASPFGKLGKDAVQLIQKVVGNRIEVAPTANDSSVTRNIENPQFAAQERMWMKMISIKIATATALGQVAWRQHTCPRSTRLTGEDKTALPEEWLGKKMINMQADRLKQRKYVEKEQVLLDTDTFGNEFFSKAGTNTALARLYL